MRILAQTFAYCLLLLTSADAIGQEASLQWIPDLESAKAAAKQSGKLVLVHFWTPECPPCEILEKGVFSQPHVVAAVEQDFVVVKVNAFADRPTADAYGVTRVPTDVILSPEGAVLSRSISPNSPIAFVTHVSQVAAEQRQAAGFESNPSVTSPKPQHITNPAYAGLDIPPTGSPSTPSISSMPNASATAAASPPTPAPTAVVNPYSAMPPANPVASPVTPIESTVAAAPESTPGYASGSTGAPPVGDRYAMNSSVVANSTYNPYASGDASQSPTSSAGSTQHNLAASTPPATNGGEFASSPVLPPSSVVAAPTPSTPQYQAQAAVAPMLPPGSPPLGFEGYCPVTMKRQWKWQPGDVRFGAVHRGRTYLFADQACRDEFLASPDAYSPALSGLDPVLQLEQGQSVPGKRQFAVEYKGQFYMFSNEQTLNRFWQHAEQYATGVQQAMQPAAGRMVR